MAASVDWHRFWLSVFCLLVGLGGAAAGLYGVSRADAAGVVVGLGLGQFMLTLAVFVAGQQAPDQSATSATGCAADI